ncbi:MAG: hypothetical protein ACHQHN_16115 [Sphingobacteriales bacterium]
MKYLYVFLWVIFLFPFFVSAQSNFKPGYVVDSKGDTLRGFINYKEWDRNPSDITFKKNATDKALLKFGIHNASAFVINGFEYYERHIVSVSQDFTYFDKLTTTLDTTTKVDTVFLRVLNKGTIVALYSYTDDIKERYYESETTDNQPKELIYHIYLEADSNAYGRLSEKYINRYRTQLHYIAEKNNLINQSLETRISESSYAENDLFKITALINGSTAKQFVSPNQFGIRWFAGVAAQYSSLKFNGDLLVAGAPASNNITPRLSVGINVFPNVIIQKLYFRLDLSFSYNHYNFFANAPNITPSGANVSLNFWQFNGTLAPQLVYNFYNRNKFKIFLDVGAAFNQSFYNNYQQITRYAVFPADIRNKYPELYHSWTAFPLKAGITVNKKFELYIGYTSATPIAAGSNARYTADVTSYMIGLNYLF